MLTGKQIAALSELLHACRPEWDTRGIQAAIRRVDDTWTWPAVCIHAVTVAANATNQTPDAIARRTVTAASMPVDHGQPCPDHGSPIRRPDGSYHCCWLATRTPPESYSHRPHPAPPGLRAQVAALLNAPAYDRLPARTSDRQNATPDGATREGDRR